MEKLFFVPHWNFWQWIVLGLAGVGCGFINALAGGGSLLTITLLILFGLPAQIANATNRISLVVLNGTAAFGYMRGGIKDRKTFFWLLFPGFFGSLIGAYLAVFLDEKLFSKIFGILLIVAALPAILNPKAFRAPPLEKRDYSSDEKKPTLTLQLVFFFIGIYSGFIQIGIGVWILLALIFVGKYGVHHSNTIKSQFLILTTGVSSTVFIIENKVILIISLVLSMGTMLGSWLATVMAKKTEIRWINWLLLFAAIGAALKLFEII